MLQAVQRQGRALNFHFQEVLWQPTAVKCGSDRRMPAVRSLGLSAIAPLLLLAFPLMRSRQLPDSSSGSAVSVVWKGKSRTSVARDGSISSRVHTQHHGVHARAKV